MTIFASRRKAQPDRTEPDPVADCEAFLRGRLAEFLEGSGQSVPNWIWINLLAHASHDELRAEATALPGSADRARDWRRSRAYLAAEVLVLADDPDALFAVQQQVLCPLEADLAGLSACVRWGPSDLASHVNAALASYRVTGRRPWDTARQTGPCS